MRLVVKLCMILVILASICEINHAKKRPRPTSSSGSKPSFSSSGSGSSPKPNLKKAALIGVGAYAGYKVAKLEKKFSRPGFGNSYKFNDWNDWREADGFLCRSNKDCKWIDDNLNCEDYELEFKPFVSPILSSSMKIDWKVLKGTGCLKANIYISTCSGWLKNASYIWLRRWFGNGMDPNTSE